MGEGVGGETVGDEVRVSDADRVFVPGADTVVLGVSGLGVAVKLENVRLMPLRVREASAVAVLEPVPESVALVVAHGVTVRDERVQEKLRVVPVQLRDRGLWLRVRLGVEQLRLKALSEALGVGLREGGVGVGVAEAGLAVSVPEVVHVCVKEERLRDCGLKVRMAVTVRESVGLVSVTEAVAEPDTDGECSALRVRLTLGLGLMRDGVREDPVSV